MAMVPAEEEIHGSGMMRDGMTEGTDNRGGLLSTGGGGVQRLSCSLLPVGPVWLGWRSIRYSHSHIIICPSSGGFQEPKKIWVDRSCGVTEHDHHFFLLVSPMGLARVTR